MKAERRGFAGAGWFAVVFLVGWRFAPGGGLAGAQDVPKWVEDAFEAYYAANDAGDPVAVMKLYAPDAVLLVGDQTYRGRPAIEEFLRRETDSTLYTCTWGIDGVLEGERLAAVSSHDSCIETPKSGGTPRTVEWEGGITIYERQPDGSWLIVREAYGNQR